MTRPCAPSSGTGGPGVPDAEARVHRPARPAAPGPPGRGRPVHPLRRRAAAAERWYRAGRRTPGSWCWTSRPSVRTRPPGPRSSGSSQSIGTPAERSCWPPTTRCWSGGWRPRVRMTPRRPAGRADPGPPGRARPAADRRRSRRRPPAGCAAWTRWRCWGRRSCSAWPRCSPAASLNLGLAASPSSPPWSVASPPGGWHLLAAPALLAAASVAFSNALLSAARPCSGGRGRPRPCRPAGSWRSRCPASSRRSPSTRPRWPTRWSCGCAWPAGRLLGTRGTSPPAIARRRMGGPGPRQPRPRTRRLGPGARARRFASMAFRLLVAALRRGGRLAVALDARGLRREPRRTIARPVRWSEPDTVALSSGPSHLVVGAVDPALSRTRDPRTRAREAAVDPFA